MDTQLQPTPAIERRQAKERRTQNRLLDFEDRRVIEWRRAADRHEAAGNTTTAMLFRNDALRLENGSGLCLQPSEKETSNANS